MDERRGREEEGSLRRKQCHSNWHLQYMIVEERDIKGVSEYFIYGSPANKIVYFYLGRAVKLCFLHMT